MNFTGVMSWNPLDIKFHLATREAIWEHIANFKHYHSECYRSVNSLARPTASGLLVRFEREDVGFTLAERRTVPVNVLRSEERSVRPSRSGH